MRRRLVAATACLLVLAAATPAPAQNSLSYFAIGFDLGNPATIKQWDLPARFEGSVVVRFERGQESGRIVWTPGPGAQLTVAENQTRRGHRMSAFLASTSGTRTVARVDGPAGVCTDLQQNELDDAAVQDGRRGVGFGLAAAAAGRVGGFHLTETSCGGPLSDDVGRALGMVSVGRQALVRGGFDIDLRRSAPLAVPGMQATVTSTVVVHVGKRRGTPRRAVAQPGGPPQPPTRELRVNYAVERVSGGVSAVATGGGELCPALASCGSSQTIKLRNGHAAHGDGYLVAYAPAPRPDADLRAAVGQPNRGGRPHGVSFAGFARWSAPAALVSVATGVAGSACSDQRHTSLFQLQLEQRRGARVAATLWPATTLRTSCAGPPLGQYLTGPPLATGTVPLRELARSRVTIHLTRPAMFATDGWSLVSHPDLTVVLRRTGVTLRTLDNSEG
jgi:hypothetical protein